MIRNVIKIKNIAKTPRSIRPYKDRNILVTFGIGETKEIDVMQGTWDVKKNPVAYFKYLGFTVVTNGVPPVKPEIKQETKKEAVKEKQATVEAPKPVEPTKPETPVASVKATGSSITIGLDGGDYKHYNPATSQWQGLRKVKDWLLDRVIYDSVKGEYYRVTSLNGEQMICASLTESDAVAITGSKAN